MASPSTGSAERMILVALPGIGALQDSLGETNRLLAAVLQELQQTNNSRLTQVAEELHDLNQKLDRLLVRES